MKHRILVSAGEASGDLYAARLVEELRTELPKLEFFGCAGPRMKAAGVRAVADAANLSVVGLVEVLGHIPRVYGEYRKLLRAVKEERPDLAILTDSPDFHLRLARRLKKVGIPVVYLVAPQVWAWRKGRIRAIRRNIDRLLCIFPFEEEFFRLRGVAADYIGHPLASMIRPSRSKAEFFQNHGLGEGSRLVSLLPGSRRGEAFRHLPELLKAVELIRKEEPVEALLAVPEGFWKKSDASILHRLAAHQVRVAEGETWDVLSYSDLALAASGTVTVEAAFLGTPMITFYKVTQASWWAGKFLVDVPFYTMVNLVAGKAVVPELMQNEMRGDRLAEEALRLLKNPAAREQMRAELGEVAACLRGRTEPMAKAAAVVRELLRKQEGVAHVA